MKIIFAQGNPESRYEKTRHNLGFMLVDKLAEQWGAKWIEKPKFRSLIAEVEEDGEKLLLVKPQTYYNDTGIAAHAIVDFYKLAPATQFLVIHDDLALPFGTIRVRKKGSDAGNNGIKSLNAHLGPNYLRIRIGVWNELRDRMDDVSFVLGNFSANEREALDKVYENIKPLLEQFISGTLESQSLDLEK